MAEPVKIALGFLAGLSLFLYAVATLAEVIRGLSEDRVKEWLDRFTSNRLASIGTGLVACTVLDSSSVTIILLIALINAGLVSFEHSLGVILGANIGTTISSQLYAFSLDDYAPIALVAGLLLWALGSNDRRKRIGLLVFSLGLIFFALGTMERAAEPLRDSRMFLEWIEKLENPVFGAAIGAVFTIIVQSSSATLGIIISLANAGTINLAAGVPVMLGAEIGTCADTLVATLGRSRAAVRAGVFHLVFNIATVCVGILCATQLAEMARAFSPGAGVARHVANAHMIFNISGVLLVTPFLGLIARSLRWVIPEQEQEVSAEGVSVEA
jgi:phosphate:Na+ symporter